MPEEVTKEEAGKSFETFDDYLATVEEPIRELYAKHTEGLTSALGKERDERRSLSEQVKSLALKADKGSKMEQDLAETVKKLEESEIKYLETQKRATFAEQAIKPEIGCVNVKAAYALAKSDDLFDKQGNPDWAAIKKVAPELFKLYSQTNAGNQTTSVTDDINRAIRSAAGL